MNAYVSESLRGLVRQRAWERCEYCLLPDGCSFLRHQPDHIVAIKHDGATSLENLAWACATCNTFKGTDIASVDWQTGQVVRLFHPRLDDWPTHFQLFGERIVGRTPIGRATVNLLGFNREPQVLLRRMLLQLGLYV